MGVDVSRPPRVDVIPGSELPPLDLVGEDAHPLLLDFPSCGQARSGSKNKKAKKKRTECDCFA